MSWLLCALTGALLVSSTSGLGTPQLGAPDAGTLGETSKSRPLHGRFLHITDFHPDPFFKPYSSTQAKAACHRSHGPAGYYGAETSACDSPISLVNATMDWIKHNIADEVDFVLWTGDSARHDNDEKKPRTRSQVVELNRLMVQKLTEVFGNGQDDEDPTGAFKIPIVPTFGNNDILPHNILLPGPNKWTVKYLDIWRGFIPEAQRHQFQQGGWFSVEVIPGKLAVISLNTLYFFNANSGVDGCAKKREPGYEHFEWLRVQLQVLRDRAMSAILIGHVPPARVDSKESWDETCWQKFALWGHQFRDVIVGSFFGHMNIDHFILQDSHNIKKGAKKGHVAASNNKAKNQALGGGLLPDDEVTVASASDYLHDLRWSWSKLPSPPSKKHSDSCAQDPEDDAEEDAIAPWQSIISMFSKAKKEPKDGRKRSFLDKLGGEYAERYSVSFVSPSVVPNYFPSIRVFEYNITGLEHLSTSPVSNMVQAFDSPFDQKPVVAYEFTDDETYKRETTTILKRKYKQEEKKLLKKRRKYKFKVPKGPTKSAAPGPAYSPQPLTFIGYTQYFANLTQINNDFVAESFNEDAPHTLFSLQADEHGSMEANGWKEGRHGKYQGKKPHVKPHPNKFKFEVEYETKTDKRYKLKDLTVRSFVDLARRMGQETDGSACQTDEEESELYAQKRRNNGKKKHRKSKNKAWLAFVERAFVGTLDPSELALFGAQEQERIMQEREETDKEEEGEEGGEEKDEIIEL